MKTNLLISIITIGLLTSCSSMYKSGQTPDDVYYSPVNGVAEEKRYEDNSQTEDDNYLRMKVRNNYRWSRIDDYSYWYDSRYNFNNCNNYYSNNWGSHYNNNWNGNNFNYFNSWSNNSFNNCNCNCGYNNGFYSNNFFGNNGWGNWNSPFYVITYKNPNIYSGTTNGSFVKAYRNKSYNNTNTIYTGKSGTSSSISTFGGLFKKVFTSSNGSSGSSTGSYDRPVRTYDTNNGSSSSGKSDAGGRSGGYKSTGTSSGSTRSGRN